MALDKVFTQGVEDEVDAIVDSEAFLNTLLDVAYSGAAKYMTASGGRVSISE